MFDPTPCTHGPLVSWKQGIGHSWWTHSFARWGAQNQLDIRYLYGQRTLTGAHSNDMRMTLVNRHIKSTDGRRDGGILFRSLADETLDCLVISWQDKYAQ